MKPTSSTKCSAVTSLLQEGYSLCQIQSKTGLGKSTIGRIKKEVDGDKENSKGGHPSKLSSGDKWSIIRQITSGSLDNAVEATHFINNTLPNLSHLKQSGMHSNKVTFMLLSGQNVLFLRRPIETGQ